MDTHSRIIAQAAKAELGPMGFKRQGRSRLWLLDHGHWLNIVGFVPSRWSVTVMLDNAAHWIWSGHGFMSLDYIVRGSHTELATEDQFTSDLAAIAREAALRAREVEQIFSSFEKMAAFAIDLAKDDDRMGPSWFGYRAGLAAGITGDMKLATHFLSGVTDDRVVPHAQRFLSVVGSHRDFLSKVNISVAKQRTALKLAPLTSDAF